MDGLQRVSFLTAYYFLRSFQAILEINSSRHNFNSPTMFESLYSSLAFVRKNGYERQGNRGYLESSRCSNQQ